MIIDCDSCAVRGLACGDCVVAVLVGAPPQLEADEQRALGVLAAAGLVPPLRLVPNPDESDAPDERSVTDPAPTVTDDTGGTSTRAV
jgi:ferredoxin